MLLLRSAVAKLANCSLPNAQPHLVSMAIYDDYIIYHVLGNIAYLLLPTELVPIWQQTRDIDQYTVYIVYLLTMCTVICW